MPQRAPQFSIILAAGKGTRMNRASCNKVCLPIAGEPAINRAISIYNACGIKEHIVVVGVMGGQVMETVGRAFENVMFAYQAEQLGTGHAARVGIKTLQGLENDPDILLAAGDRIIDATVIEELFDVFYSRNCDMALLACPRREGSNQGRIVQAANADLFAIVEASDIRQRQVFRDILSVVRAGKEPSAGELVKIMTHGFAGENQTPAEKQLSAAFGRLWHIAAVENRDPTRQQILECVPEELTQFEFKDREGSSIVMTPEEVERVPLVNNSIYLAKASCIQYGLERLDRHNAQQEEYLSQLVAILAQAMDGDKPRFYARALRVDNPNCVAGFNNPAELLEIESYIQSRQQAVTELPASDWYRTIGEWQAVFTSLLKNSRAQQKVRNELVSLYSDDPGVIEERIRAFQALVNHAGTVLEPTERVLIVRSPGRVNIMGRHIDHQGGHCNLMTIGYENLMVVHGRQDDKVCLYNLDMERFGERTFSIGDLVKDLPWDDWLSLVNSEKVSRMVRAYGGDWSQYVMAAVLRLQKKFTNTKLRGMDIVVSGNVPMAAGLSSSSSLLVGAAEATIAVNQLDTFPAQFVDLCGEGEWFVGGRWGNADHAAVKLGQQSKVIKVTFFDFAVQETVPFPEDYVLAVCDSGIKARQSTNAADLIKHRISCYQIGFKLIRKFFPQYAPLLHHLRDVNTRTLGVPLSWIYKILLHLPEQATRAELQDMLPGEDLDQFFSTHQPPEDGLYFIRGVVLFGLGECERARLFADFLKAKRIDEIGRIMSASHDGDRVATFTPAGEAQQFKAPTSNSYLLGLIEDLESGDPDRVMKAQLQWQPGRYHCSLPAIDKMVDISVRTGGVAGAQLAGAGLGGCMMVLARRDAIKQLITNLTEQYYEPAAKPASVLICKPIAGSGVLMSET